MLFRKFIAHHRKLLLGILLMLGGKVHAADTPVRIAVAANFHATLQRLVQVYQQQNDHEIQLIAGSTGLLYQQILHGAPFDLLFAADEARPEKLYQRGLTAAMPRVYALGKLAFWTPGVSKPTQQQLVAWRDRVALANPALAPYGGAALQVIQQRFAHPEQVQQVLGHNVSQVVQFVVSGNVDAGFVGWAQLDQAQRQQALLIPDDWHQPIVQSAVLLRNGTGLAQAEAFLDYVLGEGRSIVLASGYQMAPIPPDQTATQEGQLQ